MILDHLIILIDLFVTEFQQKALDSLFRILDVLLCRFKKE